MSTTTQTVTFRPVASQDDWQSACKFRNEYLFQRPLTVEQLVETAKFQPAHAKSRRTLMSVDGTDVGYCSTIENHWSTTKGRFETLTMALDPHHFERLFDHEYEAAVSDGASKISTWLRSTDDFKLKAIYDRGFVETQRNPESALFLDEFDPSAYGHLIFQTRRRYEILSYSEFSKLDPDCWKQEAWKIEMDIMSDVPLPEPFEPTPFEDWVKELESNLVDPDALFVALLDGTPAGISQLLPNRVDTTLTGTGLTGVRRDHRRHGLATALKAVALTWAKERGFKSVWTDNEENNPMYGLNLKLGFEKQFDSVCLEKTV